MKRIEFFEVQVEVNCLIVCSGTRVINITLCLPHVQSFSCFVVLPNDPAGQCFALSYLSKRIKIFHKKEQALFVRADGVPSSTSAHA